MQIQTIVGLGIIIIGLILQLGYSWNGKREIRKRFLILFALGTAWLVVDSFRNSLYWNAAAYVITLGLVLGILIAIGNWKNKNISKKKKR